MQLQPCLVGVKFVVAQASSEDRVLALLDSLLESASTLQAENPLLSIIPMGLARR